MSDRSGRSNASISAELSFSRRIGFSFTVSNVSKLVGISSTTALSRLGDMSHPSSAVDGNGLLMGAISVPVR